MSEQTIRDYFMDMSYTKPTHISIYDVDKELIADTYVDDKTTQDELLKFSLCHDCIDEPILGIDTKRDDDQCPEAVFETRIFLEIHDDGTRLDAFDFVDIFVDAMKLHDYYDYDLVTVVDRNGNTIFGRHISDRRDLSGLADALSEVEKRFSHRDILRSCVRSDHDPTYPFYAICITLDEEDGPSHQPVDFALPEKLREEK